MLDAGEFVARDSGSNLAPGKLIGKVGSGTQVTGKATTRPSDRRPGCTAYTRYFPSRRLFVQNPQSRSHSRQTYVPWIILFSRVLWPVLLIPE